VGPGEGPRLGMKESKETGNAFHLYQLDLCEGRRTNYSNGGKQLGKYSNSEQ
jgi:hypothetical protein